MQSDEPVRTEQSAPVHPSNANVAAKPGAVQTSRLRAVSETIGLLAVVGSLIFVGLEVRQNAAATRAATAQNLSDGWLQWNLAMSTAEAWSPIIRMTGGSNDFDDADVADQNAVESTLRSLFQNWSNLHYHYLRGNLDPLLWAGALSDIERNVRYDDTRWGQLVAWSWHRNRHTYHQDFQNLIDGMLKETGR